MCASQHNAEHWQWGSVSGNQGKSIACDLKDEPLLLDHPTDFKYQQFLLTVARACGVLCVYANKVCAIERVSVLFCSYPRLPRSAYLLP
jgi:hypothetical protein